MTFKHYDVVRAASPSDLAEKLTHKLKEGWQPFGSPVAITPYTLMQAVGMEGEPQVCPSSDSAFHNVIVVGLQSNATRYVARRAIAETSHVARQRREQMSARTLG
ncbi:hypothetical protein UP85_24890, partial [Escherichia coli]|uniref:DUF1737 domain-containing protein n=1 Tax=Escherichia coli TaxID=562 RepID=UPI000B6DC007